MAGVRGSGRALCLWCTLFLQGITCGFADGDGLVDGRSRVALVVGNATYETAPLRNPVRDARAVADSLTRLGFRVTLRTDLDLPKMLDALTRFARETRNDDVRLFFYAGHGLQFGGKNYLLPVEARIDSLDDISTAGADVELLIDHLQRPGKGLNIVILDACRNYPLALTARPVTRGARPIQSVEGLVEILAPRGTIIALSTAPGSVARDGVDTHSVYVKHLLANLGVPGLSVEQLFKRVRTGVMTETDQKQVPWENSSLVGNFCFRPGPRGECPGTDSTFSSAQPTPAPR